MAATVIKNFIAKALFKKKGAIANNKAVEFSANALEQRLKNLGIDPNAIRSEQELNQILSYVKQAEDQAFSQRFGDMLGGSKFDRKGEVFDMSGKKLDSSRGIMGGTQIDEKSLKEGLMKTDNPFSDLVKTTEKGPKTLKEREAEVLAKLEKGNKETVQRIRNRKMVEEAIDNASPGFAGDRKYDAQLVADDLADKRFGKEFYDLDEIDQMELYDEAYQGLSDSRFKNKPDPEDMAQGGRAGFSKGSGLKTLFDFLNKKSPMKAYTDYLNSIKTRMKAGKEAEVAGEVIPIAAGGALITNQLKKKLKAMNEEQKKEFKKDMEKKADGGRIGLKEGNKKITIDAAGSKSGKQQIMGAPKGITADSESINAIIKADIPISQKIDLLAKYQYGKGRTRIEQDDQEIFMDEGGFKSRDIGLGFNKDGEGIGGTLMYNMETGDPEFNIGFRKKFKDGSGMTRRSFLKILGGLAAIPIVGKFLKPIKTAKGIKSVPIIKTGDVPGKPEWFDALVNKVILEGDDVTKKFATQERQVVHMKKIDDDTSVTVTQDLNDGSIIVDVDDPIRNVMGESGQDTSVQMMLKKGQADETTKGTPADEFSFTENDMRNYMDGPDDYTTEFVENTVDKMSDLTSDLGKIKSYATGKGPTMKQIVESKKRKDMVKFAEENPSEYAANRGPEFDPDYDDYASGGIARMLGE